MYAVIVAAPFGADRGTGAGQRDRHAQALRAGQHVDRARVTALGRAGERQLAGRGAALDAIGRLDVAERGRRGDADRPRCGRAQRSSRAFGRERLGAGSFGGRPARSRGSAGSAGAGVAMRETARRNDRHDRRGRATWRDPAPRPGGCSARCHRRRAVAGSCGAQPPRDQPANAIATSSDREPGARGHAGDRSTCRSARGVARCARACQRRRRDHGLRARALRARAS